MKREEEKKKARWEYVSKRLAIPDFPTYNAEYELEAAFDEGAQWADKNPISNIEKSLIYLIDASCEKAMQNTIDKACDWLRTELDKEEGLHYIHVHGFGKERREIFLEDFRKAMKGEQI